MHGHTNIKSISISSSSGSSYCSSINSKTALI